MGMSMKIGMPSGERRKAASDRMGRLEEIGSSWNDKSRDVSFWDHERERVDAAFGEAHERPCVDPLRVDGMPVDPDSVYPILNLNLWFGEWVCNRTGWDDAEAQDEKEEGEEE